MYPHTETDNFVWWDYEYIFYVLNLYISKCIKSMYIFMGKNKLSFKSNKVFPLNVFSFLYICILESFKIFRRKILGK